MELSSQDIETLETVDRFIEEAIAEMDVADDESVAQMQVDWEHLRTKLTYQPPQQ